MVKKVAKKKTVKKVVGPSKTKIKQAEKKILALIMALMPKGLKITKDEVELLKTDVSCLVDDTVGMINDVLCSMEEEK